MKKFYFLVFIYFFSWKSFSQSLIPSTVGEVYNFEVGDSFEYEFEVNWADSYHSFARGYALYVITADSIENLGMILYATTTDVYYSGFSPSPNYHPNYQAGIPYSYTLIEKDSAIWFNQVNLDTSCGKVDSAYVNQFYGGRKQNEVSRMCFENSWDRKFVAGLGLVISSDIRYDSGWPTGSSQNLIYYHKANGETWGTPQYFVVNGINDLRETQMSIQVFPNSTHLTFQLQLSSVPSKLTYFKLYDALGREVKHELILSSTTTLNREDLSNGIYFWQVESEGKILESGKIVFE